MKNLFSILALATLLQFCSKDTTYDNPIEFGKSYFLKIDNLKTSVPTKYLNTISFFNDGSYIRTEDIGQRIFENEKKVTRYLIKFPEIKGSWKIENEEIVLKDLDFGKYYVYNHNNEIQGFKIPFDKFQFGSKEKLSKGKICRFENNIIFYDQ